MDTSKLHPIMQDLIKLIAKEGWQQKFEEALKNAQSYQVPAFADIKTVDDMILWLDKQLSWVPHENETGTQFYDNLVKANFLFDRPPLNGLQNSETPHDKEKPLTPLSKWMLDYVNAMGDWMDKPESITPDSVKSYYDCLPMNMNEYKKPNGGWKTYNQMFAREIKPGRRPIAAIEDQSVVTFAADCAFAGWWENREDSHVTLKGLHWNIEELLEGSPYKDRFKGGYFMHAFLNTIDYHRQHAPVGGKILEARTVPGVAYVQIDAVPDPVQPGVHDAKIVRSLQAPDKAGFEFMQARGLVIIDSPIGLVAVLPIGMSQVSSVIVTAEVGQTVRKGEEISYFQFGGSDIVMVFEQSSNISFTAQPGNHYRFGSKLADAYPVIK